MAGYYIFTCTCGMKDIVDRDKANKEGWECSLCEGRKIMQINVEKRVPGLSRLLVQKVDEERKSKGGIVLADTFESTTQTCIILSVGECKGKYTAGHYAYINRHAGVEVGMDELVILEGDILFTEDRSEL